ncbi:MAG: hypothetical protein Q6368_006900 [Candidatus Baldrarchaeota archaeon]
MLNRIFALDGGILIGLALGEKEIKREIEREAFKVNIVFPIRQKNGEKGRKNIIDI